MWMEALTEVKTQTFCVRHTSIEEEVVVHEIIR
jgi:hypothetical protein